MLSFCHGFSGLASLHCSEERLHSFGITSWKKMDPRHSFGITSWKKKDPVHLFGITSWKKRTPLKAKLL